MRIFLVITCLHLPLFFLLFWGLAKVNASFAIEYIPNQQIAAAAFLYIFYVWLLTLVYWFFFHGRWVVRMLCMLAYAGLTLSLIPTVELLVLEIFPRLDIQFFDLSREENKDAFHFRLIRGYIFANLISLLLVCGLTLVLFWQRRRHMQKMWQQHVDRIAAIKYTSHFLNTLFVSEFGKSLIDDAPKNAKSKRDIVQFLGYLLQVEELGAMGKWDDEIDQLACFVRLLRMYYGEAAIDVQIDQPAGRYPKAEF